MNYTYQSKKLNSLVHELNDQFDYCGTQTEQYLDDISSDIKLLERYYQDKGIRKHFKKFLNEFPLGIETHLSWDKCEKSRKWRLHWALYETCFAHDPDAHEPNSEPIIEYTLLQKTPLIETKSELRILAAKHLVKFHTAFLEELSSKHGLTSEHTKGS